MNDLATLQASLKKLEDIEDIRSLRHRYAYLANIVDGSPGDPAQFAALFTADGTLDLGMGLATGPAEIEAMMRAATTQWKCAMHFMLNPLIQVDGDEAEGSVTGLFAFTTETNPAPVWLSNIYQDRYARTPEGWKFTSVRIRTAFVDPAFLEIYAALLQ